MVKLDFLIGVCESWGKGVYRKRRNFRENLILAFNVAKIEYR